MPRIIIEGYQCQRCGYRWWPRNGTGYRDKNHPRHCPKCKTPYWHRVRKTEVAGRSDEELKEIALVQIEGYQCERCGYRWGPRDGTGRWPENNPKYCPKCRSQYWNKPREHNLPDSKRAVQWSPFEGYRRRVT